MAGESVADREEYQRQINEVLMRLELMGSMDDPLGALDRSWLEYYLNGSNLTAAAVDAFEGSLDDNPNQPDIRTLLLGYYHGKSEFSAKSNFARHVYWFIENHPDAQLLGMFLFEDGEIYEEGKARWQKALGEHPYNAKVLGNAARYFEQRDQPLAEDALLKAKALDPENEEWPERLGRLYMRSMRFGSAETRVATAEKAYAAFRAAYDLASVLDRENVLLELSRSAFAAGKFSEAEQFANETLEFANRKQDFGEGFHYAHIVLGRIALKNGDIEKAKEHLLDAGKTTGSDFLNYVGPDMTLALELLNQGEREAVIEFINFCKTFWFSESSRLKDWKQTIEHGGIPDFGVNLVY
jgi:tetratricopeptide (TPR) repeat protein